MYLAARDDKRMNINLAFMAVGAGLLSPRKLGCPLLQIFVNILVFLEKNHVLTKNEKEHDLAECMENKNNQLTNFYTSPFCIFHPFVFFSLSVQPQGRRLK